MHTTLISSLMWVKKWVTRRETHCFSVLERYVPTMRFLLVIGFFLISLSAGAARLRVEGERAWLTADGTPLSKVLHLFEERGVEVLIDPSLKMGRVSGDWEAVQVDRLIAQLASPHSYVLEWKRVHSPLGELDQISSIRIFSDGNAAAAKRLTSKGRVLDVVTGKNGQKYIRNELMIGFKEGATLNDLNALLARIGGTVVEVIDPPGIYRIKLNEGMSVEDARAIANTFEGVEHAEPNRAFSNSENPVVPIPAEPGGMNLNLQPGETAIAVFDSGLDPAYADLPIIRGTYNAVDPGAEMTDPSGHGTLVSLIASGSVSPIGSEPSTEGVPVLTVRVFDENGMTSSDTIMRAIDYSMNSGIRFINMSFGTYEDVGFLENAVDYAASQGVEIYVASGNDGKPISVNPAASPATRSIGALSPDGTVAPYSNTGPSVDYYENGTVWFGGERHDGTSFASPRRLYKTVSSLSGVSSTK